MRELILRAETSSGYKSACSFVDAAVWLQLSRVSKFKLQARCQNDHQTFKYRDPVESELLVSGQQFPLYYVGNCSRTAEKDSSHLVELAIKFFEMTGVVWLALHQHNSPTFLSDKISR